MIVQGANNNILDKIESETDRRKLLSLAFLCEGVAKLGTMTPEYYAECMILLGRRLGFAIIPETLQEAYDEYIRD